MTLERRHSGFSRPLLLSCCVLGVSIAVQGAFFFPRRLKEIFRPLSIEIRRFIPCDSSQTAIVYLRCSDDLLDAPFCTLCDLELKPDSLQARTIALGFDPWAAAASSSGRIFLNAANGDVYSLARFSSLSQPLLLGNHPLGLITIMETSPDGSLALTANYETTMAWQFGSAGCLWQRNDLDVSSAYYSEDGRLFCGLFTGAIVELHAHLGTTLRVFETACGAVVELAASPQSNRIVVLGSHDCAVIDLETGQPFFKRYLPSFFACPRFSPDGEWLLMPCEDSGRELLVLSASTGQLLRTMTGAKARIVGIAIGAGGVVHAWDASATITAWELASGRLLYQHRLECIPASASSS